MGDVKLYKIYQLYDLFNDFNRLAVLLELYDNELSVAEINERTNIKNIVIFHQLEYLKTKKVVDKYEIDGIEKYKIVDKTLNRFIGKMKNYVTKE